MITRPAEPQTGGEFRGCWEACKEKRILTSVSSHHGEILFLVGSDHAPPLLQVADYILMPYSVMYRKTESYQEQLHCNEAAEWRTARPLEQRALVKRGVMRALLLK